MLSLVTAVPEITAAAALSAGSLGAFAPPPGIARLVIARDNDEDGALAAERLARRCARAGVAATVVVPAGNDFNDDLVELGAAALRARFAPLFRPAACTHRERPAGRGACAMSGIAFRRISPDEARIYWLGDHVGDVYALDDPLREGGRYFVVHLDEDPRGPCRVHDRSRIREVTERLVLSHPLWG